MPKLNYISIYYENGQALVRGNAVADTEFGPVGVDLPRNGQICSDAALTALAQSKGKTTWDESDFIEWVQASHALTLQNPLQPPTPEAPVTPPEGDVPPTAPTPPVEGETPLP